MSLEEVTQVAILLREIRTMQRAVENMSKALETLKEQRKANDSKEDEDVPFSPPHPARWEVVPDPVD